MRRKNDCFWRCRRLSGIMSFSVRSWMRSRGEKSARSETKRSTRSKKSKRRSIPPPVRPHSTSLTFQVTKNAKAAILSQQEQHTEQKSQTVQEIQDNIFRKQRHLNLLNREEQDCLVNIKERKNTIEEKTERINELRKKKLELQKFRYVLNYKIKELKRDKGPREEKIAKMKDQLAMMNGEIIHFQVVNNNLTLIITDLQLRQKGMEREIVKYNNIWKKNN
jgi:cilia- and flagella-associated protein 57